MNLVSMRLVTNNMKRMVGFYAEITGLKPDWFGEDFAELVTPSCTLAIGSKRAMDSIPGRRGAAGRQSHGHHRVLCRRCG